MAQWEEVELDNAAHVVRLRGRIDEHAFSRDFRPPLAMVGLA
jgi:hypothetical protein